MCIVSFVLLLFSNQGVNWLLWNWWNHRSSVLADEMGLGKTIQTVGFLDQLWNVRTDGETLEGGRETEGEEKRER